MIEPQGGIRSGASVGAILHQLKEQQMRGFRLSREQQVPKGAIKIADKQSDAVAYLYSSNTSFSVGKPAAMAFTGKSDKPVWRYYFNSEEQRGKKIAETFENRRGWLELRAKRRKERTEWVPDYRVGDILHTSWGYDQTNVEFFEVVEARGKYVWLRELQQSRKETGFMSGNCEPIPGKFAEPRFEGDERGQVIRRLAQKSGVKIDDVRTAWRGGGSHYWSSYA
jgi:hypothetical protein